MPITTAMKNYLKGNLHHLAVFLKITAKDGSVIRVWNGTRAKIIPGDGTYLAFPISPSKLQQSAGLKADNLEVAAVYAGAFTKAALRARKWEGARCEYAVYNYKDFSMGYAERRVGFLGRTEIGKFSAKPELISLSSKLAQPVGQSFNADCDVEELGDTRCGVDLNGFTADGFRIRTTGTVASVSNRQQFSVNFSEPMIRGLKASYYAGVNFDTLIAERIDQTIDHDYGENAPFPGMPTDHFSLRLEGFITPLYTETHTFEVEHDDGVKLWVGSLASPLINQWTTLGTHSNTIALAAGTPYNFKLEYKDEVSLAKIKLRWSSASQALQIVPAARFSPPAGYAIPDNLYHRGRVTFLSGNNQDFDAQILANTGSALTLYLPTFYDVSIGDSVRLVVGCNRTIAQCRDRFANGINFQGYFMIPGTSRLFSIPEQ